MFIHHYTFFSFLAAMLAEKFRSSVSVMRITAIANATLVSPRSLALSLARNATIPQGQVLGNEEMESLVNQLFACSNVKYTPDGKSVLCILPQQEIEKLLG